MISNLINKQGNAVKNQFVITEDSKITFQSYNSKIVEINKNKKSIVFYSDYNYSNTTSKHSNKFLSDVLGADIKTTDVEKMIKDKKYNNFNVILINK